LRHVHRGLGPVLGADLGFVFRLVRGFEVEATYYLSWTPRGEKLHARTKLSALREQAQQFARDRKSPGDPRLLLTVVESGGHPIGVFAFLRPGRAFGRAEAKLGIDVAEILGRHITHRERERIFEIRERIVRKVLLQHRPADILYQVLHGLKRLLHYDHSATVLTFDRESLRLAVRAETIAWKKGKSMRIGAEFSLDRMERDFVASLSGAVLLDPTSADAALPSRLLAHLEALEPGAPPARSVLLAALRQREETVGLLAVRSLMPNALVSEDRETIDSFIKIVSATALHSEFFRQQENRLLDAEKRSALGELARAISHDLNNAFGVIQPLLQTLRRDVEAGRIDTHDLKTDLATLDQYVSSSLRIFQGLLSFARGSAEEAQPVSIADSVDEVLSLLSRGLRTQGIRVTREIAQGLPRVHSRRQDIEQLLLNLLNNAKESMPDGGQLTVRVWIEKDGEGQAIRLSIADTGRGVPASLLPRVFEPFYSTKQGGTGLGLDICRSIVWEYDGAIWLDSEERKGTTAHVRLPLYRRLDADSAVEAASSKTAVSGIQGEERMRAGTAGNPSSRDGTAREGKGRGET